MKKISSVVLTSLLFLVELSAGAQTYQLMPDSNASWLVQERDSEHATYHRYFLNETPDDTLINGQIYTKIFSETNGTYNHYEGAFRNDASGRIFFIPNGETPQFPQEESILQDFSKTVGDTVFDVAVHYGNYRGTFDFVVDSVQYYPCGPYTLKSVSLHTIEEIPSQGSFMLITWIEKIGNIYGGIFNFPHGGLSIYKLICQNASDTILYSTPVFDYLPVADYMVYRQGNCEFYLSTEEPKDSVAFSVFPCPFSESVTLQSGIKYTAIEFRIYNLMGGIIRSEYIPAFSNEYKINIPPDVPKGTYILSVYHKNKQLWRQVMIKN